jgi:hypothetical protein
MDCFGVVDILSEFHQLHVRKLFAFSDGNLALGLTGLLQFQDIKFW